MNQNYIAPEALDDSHIAFCRKCAGKFSTVEQKMTFYQGTCPSCGQNPSTLTVGPKEAPAPGSRLGEFAINTSAGTGRYIPRTTHQYHYVGSGRTSVDGEAEVSYSGAWNQSEIQVQNEFPAEQAISLDQIASDQIVVNDSNVNTFISESTFRSVLDSEFTIKRVDNGNDSSGNG